MSNKLEDLALWTATRLKTEIQTGLNPNTLVNQFLGIRLVHYWASLGQLEHLKVLYAAQADFNSRTRYGQTARDELLRRWDRSSNENYISCLNWFSRTLPDTPPVTPSSSPASSFHLATPSPLSIFY